MIAESSPLTQPSPESIPVESGHRQPCPTVAIFEFHHWGGWEEFPGHVLADGFPTHHKDFGPIFDHLLEHGYCLARRLSKSELPMFDTYLLDNVLFIHPQRWLVLILEYSDNAAKIVLLDDFADLCGFTRECGNVFQL